VGEQALIAAINDLRQRGKTIVLITHRPTVLGATTKLLLMKDGAAQAFGPTKEVLAALQEANKKMVEAQQQAVQQAKQRAAQAGVNPPPADNATAPASATEEGK